MRQLILLINVAKDSIATTSKLSVHKTSAISPESTMNIYVTVGLTLVVLVATVGFLLYLADQATKHWQFLSGLKDVVKKNYFLILLAFPIFYLFYYYGFYIPYRGDGKASIWLKEETADLLWTISQTFLVTGTITAALKWLNNLAFFKKQFSELIRSDDFSTVLSEKMKELALSDDYLLPRNDLEEIWSRVTIVKYQQKFPELTEQITTKIENDLYLEKSLSYYLKNYRMQINFSLEGEIIKIVEISSFTVVAHSINPIEINFGTTSPVADDGDIYTKIIEDCCRCDGKILKLEVSDGDQIGQRNITSDLQFTAMIHGSKKYVIERQIEMTQNINDDRVFSFSTARIVDEISINLKHDNKLKLFFSPVGKHFFDSDNHMRGDNSYSYIARDLFLPGEKFKIFIYKKG